MKINITIEIDAEKLINEYVDCKYNSFIEQKTVRRLPELRCWVNNPDSIVYAVCEALNNELKNRRQIHGNR